MTVNRTVGIRLKIERAKKHISDLEEVIIPFFDGSPYGVGAELDTQISHYLIHLESVKPLPAIIPLLVGDAVHNLRSALDHLAWQLVEAAGGVPNKDTYFPICNDPIKGSQQYASALGKGEISKMYSGAEKLLASIQPYQSGDDTLFCLHTLDIHDKHRIVLAVYATLSSWGLKNPSIWFSELGFGTAVTTGDELCRIPADTWEKSHDNIDFGFYVAFGEPEILKGKSILETLNSMADLVESLLADFTPFLV